jgi:hypothetical protein
VRPVVAAWGLTAGTPAAWALVGSEEEDDDDEEEEVIGLPVAGLEEEGEEEEEGVVGLPVAGAEGEEWDGGKGEEEAAADSSLVGDSRRRAWLGRRTWRILAHRTAGSRAVRPSCIQARPRRTGRQRG